MAVQRHYKNAPITEALIDIQVQLPTGESIAVLEDVFSGVKERYPTRKDRIYREFQFSAGEEVGASAKQTRKGYAFYTEDRLQVFQARLDGFTFSRLRPYGSWLQLRDEAKRLWDVYRGIVNPPRMTRIAVRYINRIDIPLPMRDFKDY